eukprot:CAMPEP_0113504538 /NCGR_PEP_ID=MMETSP0014_2-20120614/34768_1 /TAXON_ID=2857 /ORGANISM="Nitzschia sp." /LENGTH=995 /DNA_ID=CAMNT_0000399653 /DNA_START=443 /DNA_END=3430 /DNA_ORIENTATION=- /assembly_acc=CAM_ASM_000159
MEPRSEDEEAIAKEGTKKHKTTTGTSTKKPSSERSSGGSSHKKKTKKKSSKRNVTDESESSAVAEGHEEEALSSTKSTASSKSKKKKKKKNKSLTTTTKKKHKHHHHHHHEGGGGEETELHHLEKERVVKDPPAIRGSEMMVLESETANGSGSHAKSKKKHIEQDGEVVSTSKKKITDEVEDGYEKEGAVEVSQKNSECVENGEETKNRVGNGELAEVGMNGKNFDDLDPHRSLDTIYGSKCGAILTLSMLLNAGLMVYAHVGLSGVVMSSQPPIPEVDPSPTGPPSNSTSPPGGGNFTGACNPADFEIWQNGGEMNRTEHSTFCSLEYNDAGCILDEGCISECFQTEFGYSQECSVCFSAVPNCGLEKGCALICLGDSLSQECQECNIPCTQELDTCIGFPDEAAPPSGSGKCDSADLEIWNSGNGDQGRVEQSEFCSLQYGGTGCLLGETCIQECFQEEYGYSAECSTCFGAIPSCGLALGCAPACAADLNSEECATCNIPCIDDLLSCIGVSSRRDQRDLQRVVSSYWESQYDGARQRFLQGATESEGCVEVDLDAVNQWYEVYQLTFVDSIRKAWQGDAYFLALLIVIFSGIWPYAKNLILIFAWYAPLSVERRDSILTWLLRLSKYTLVDVFAVVAVLVGVQLELNISGATVITRAEPRPAIIAFFMATLWEFVQIELTVYLHDKHVHYSTAGYGDEIDGTGDGNNELSDAEVGEQIPKETNGTNSSVENIGDGVIATKPCDGNFLMAMRFRKGCFSNKNEDSLAPVSVAGIYAWIGFLLVVTIATFLSGALSELVSFTTSSIASPDECVKSYNLVSFGGGLINELSLKYSNGKAGTWTLYIAYILLVVFLPIVVHIMQLCVLAVSTFTLKSDRSENGNDSVMKKCKEVCHCMSSLFGFSSVEVLLIGIFAVEHKFEDFVSALAGPGNAAFFTISSNIGSGFYILIVYAFASGFLQYFIHCCESEYFKNDTYHKVNVIWTKMFGCWLKKS